jgi:hypothetical protein
MRRERKLVAFLIPATASELLVAIAGALRGKLTEGAADVPLLLFIGLQLALATYLVRMTEDARRAAIFLALFSVTYALFAAFVAGMAFADTWL